MRALSEKEHPKTTGKKTVKIQNDQTLVNFGPITSRVYVERDFKRISVVFQTKIAARIIFCNKCFQAEKISVLLHVKMFEFKYLP